MNMKKTIGLFGFCFLVTGPFTPVVRFPRIGNLSFIEHNTLDGILIVTLALLSGLFVFARNYRALLFTGLGTAAVVGNMFLYFESHALRPAPFGGPSGAVVSSSIGFANLQWGWLVLGMGVLLLLVCPFVSDAGGGSQLPRPCIDKNHDEHSRGLAELSSHGEVDVHRHGNSC